MQLVPKGCKCPRLQPQLPVAGVGEAAAAGAAGLLSVAVAPASGLDSVVAAALPAAAASAGFDPPFPA